MTELPTIPLTDTRPADADEITFIGTATTVIKGRGIFHPDRSQD
jgi:hypothetical protein